MSTVPSDLSHLAATDMAAAVTAGEISARELTLAHLSRIAGIGKALNAVVVVDAERAVAEAEKVDRAVAGGAALGPLAGVPMTVKESFAVEGLQTTAGNPELVGVPARSDAPAVAALRRAGAVIVGKTNVPTQLADLQCDNPVYGRTSNPWDGARSCGGSSGGSAAAVAARLSALDLGSDLSGSIRVPASWCGVVGLRPSNGWISKRGHLPWPLDGLIEPPVSVVGPLGRSAVDVALAFSGLTGVPLAAPPPFSQLRVGVWLSAPEAPIDSETEEAISTCCRVLSDAGARLVDLPPPVPVGPALDLAQRLIDAEISYGLSDDQWEEARTSRAPVAQFVRDHLADQEARLAVAQAWSDLFRDLDAVLCPATPVAALPHFSTPRSQRRLLVDGTERSFEDLASWSLLTSLAHLPSVTMPAGRGGRSGLPIGMQLVGRYRHDAELLGAARRVEEALPDLTPPGW